MQMLTLVRETHLAPAVLREIDAQTIDDWQYMFYLEGVRQRRDAPKQRR